MTKSAHPAFPPTPTPVALLHRAVADMRIDASATDAGEFLTAVADWLASCAVVLEVNPAATKAHALNVARAYRWNGAPR